MVLLYKHCFSFDEILLIWGSPEHDLYSQKRIDDRRDRNKRISMGNSFRNGTPEIVKFGEFLWFPSNEQIHFVENGSLYEDISGKPSNYTNLVRLDNVMGPRVLFLSTDKGYMYRGAYKAIDVKEDADKQFILWRKCYEWEYDEKKILRYLISLRLFDKNRQPLKDIKILYCHGLASRGNSDSAEFFRQLGATVISPDIPLEPNKAISFLKELARNEMPDVIVGSSLGGMLAQKIQGYPKVLINPAFHVSNILRRMIGTNKFFHKREDGATTFDVTDELCEAYERVEEVQFSGVTRGERENTIAMFGKQDNVLDWEQSKNEYLNYYENFSIFDGGHRLTKDLIQKNVCHEILYLMIELI